MEIKFPIFGEAHNHAQQGLLCPVSLETEHGHVTDSGLPQGSGRILLSVLCSLHFCAGWNADMMPGTEASNVGHEMTSGRETTYSTQGDWVS